MCSAPPKFIWFLQKAAARNGFFRMDELGDDPNWSADGRKVVFHALGNAQPTKDRLRILDLASHQVTVLPGSTSVYSPRWSPDGKYIAALSTRPRPEGIRHRNAAMVGVSGKWTSGLPRVVQG